MSGRSAVDVARRCLCLELLFQRLLAETDDDDDGDREAVRRMWLAKLGDLEVAEALLPEERALLERPVGELTEEEIDDIDGRASTSLVYLWALGRIAARPSFAATHDTGSLLGEHGLLGDGSISRAKDAAVQAALRPDAELTNALSAYRRARGKAKEVDDPERMFAEVAAAELGWILGEDPE